jgi:hypothetical protein
MYHETVTVKFEELIHTVRRGADDTERVVIAYCRRSIIGNDENENHTDILFLRVWPYTAQAQSIPPLTMALLDVGYRMFEGLLITLSIEKIGVFLF